MEKKYLIRKVQIISCIIGKRIDITVHMSLISMCNTELSSFQLPNSSFRGSKLLQLVLFVAVNDVMLGAEDKGGVLGGQEGSQRPSEAQYHRGGRETGMQVPISVTLTHTLTQGS